jgi:hypothetical protein
MIMKQNRDAQLIRRLNHRIISTGNIVTTVGPFS